jgi:prophage regulatory protein
VSQLYQRNFDELPDSAFIRLNHLISTGVIPFSASTIWRKVKNGQFPTPTKISANITAWNVGAVRRWHSDMLSASRKSVDNAGGQK